MAASTIIQPSASDVLVHLRGITNGFGRNIVHENLDLDMRRKFGPYWWFWHRKICTLAHYDRPKQTNGWQY